VGFELCALELALLDLSICGVDLGGDQAKFREEAFGNRLAAALQVGGFILQLQPSAAQLVEPGLTDLRFPRHFLEPAGLDGLDVRHRAVTGQQVAIQPVLFGTALRAGVYRFCVRCVGWAGRRHGFDDLAIPADDFVPPGSGIGRDRMIDHQNALVIAVAIQVRRIRWRDGARP